MNREKKELLDKTIHSQEYHDQKSENKEEKTNVKYATSKEIFDLNNNKFSVMTNLQDMNVIPHKHNFFQLMYIYSGKIVQYLNGGRVELIEGSIVIINKDVIHSINKGTRNDKVLHIGINESVFDDTFFNLLVRESAIGNYLYQSLHLNRELTEYIIIENIDEDIKNLLNEIYHEYMGKFNGFEQNLTAYLVLVFNKLFLQPICKNTIDVHEKNNTKKRMDKIKKYLNENYKSATLTTLTDYVHVHPNYLSSFIGEQEKKTSIDC